LKKKNTQIDRRRRNAGMKKESEGGVKLVYTLGICEALLAPVYSVEPFRS
jgi:hypothetical protein